MNRDEATKLLTAHAVARDALLARLTTAAAESGRSLWQVGSFAEGRGDDWSDLDLVVTGGPCLLDEAALTMDYPPNGPAEGGYTGAAHLTGPLLVWVDWYTWPADTPVPVEARLLTGEDRPGDLPLTPALDRLGRGATPKSVDPDTSALAMIPIAAKFLARGRDGDAAGMAGMLNGRTDGDPLTRLRERLAAIGGPPSLTARITLTLQVAEVLKA
ncbi:hypothetical protein [Phytomonospora endophytica]|uniref:Polymerase nucleotidyl transferase domain-containing protein n=1 Tax=Phytomonospora endophytica TaxID=714109 RepID=A0A841F725_9ACTN|nr:hypothetical protein [Phytomonospora endophytica]MBB6032791.1 hypothetical protein [Phytomonospora endophytica]GIG66060.1 hypothetical protein Pen01_23550 [Phytomonospora endophytica]